MSLRPLTKSDFERLERVPKAHAHGTYYSLSAAPIEGGAKCACIVSKKTAPRAVDRVRARRQCREVARHSAKELVAHALIVKVRPAALKASYAELKNEMQRLVRDATKPRSPQTRPRV